MTTKSKPTSIGSKLQRVQSLLKAPKDKTNKFGGFGYRTKEGTLEVLKPLCEQVGCYIKIDDDMKLVGERYYVESTATIVCINSGDSISAKAFAREPLTQKAMVDPMCTGSASSYSGKYALQNLLGISDSSLDPDATHKFGKDQPKVSNRKSLDEVLI
jgi:hypothetical protein